MAFTLRRIQETQGESLKDLIDQAKIGERIVLHQGLAREIDIWANSYDFYHEDQRVIYKNGQPFFKRDFDEWKAAPEGIIVRSGKRYLTNGIHNALEGEYNDWVPHQTGIFTLKKYEQQPGQAFEQKKPDEILLNGEEVVFKQKIIQGIRVHTRGFLAGIHGASTWLINGSKTLVGGRPYSNSGTTWEAWGDKDVVLYRKGEFFLNAATVIHRDWCTAWMMHKHGIVLWQDETISLVVLRK